MMMQRARETGLAGRLGRTSLAVCVAATAMVMSAGAAVGASSRADIKARVGEAFNAEVLGMETVTHDGTTYWRIKMMHKGGNSNMAFRVDHILVNPETGEPLRGSNAQVRGSENLTRQRTSDMEHRPDVLRGRPWR